MNSLTGSFSLALFDAVQSCSGRGGAIPSAVLSPNVDPKGPVESSLFIARSDKSEENIVDGTPLDDSFVPGVGYGLSVFSLHVDASGDAPGKSSSASSLSSGAT